MLYLESTNDRIQALLMQMEFGSQEPEKITSVFNDESRLSFIPFEVHSLEQNNLVFEKHTGSWSFLDNDELSLFSRLSNTPILQVYADYSSTCTSRIDEFLLRLYLRGLLEVDKRHFILPELFNAGAIRTNSPLFLIVPTEKCNLSCSYCFAESSPSRREHIQWEHVERFIELILDYKSSTATIEFAGGEPLLDLPLLEQTLKYSTSQARRIGKRLYFLLQSNGTRLTPSVVKIVDRYKIGLGLSLDGTQALHDKNRPYASGCGSYLQTLRGIRLLQSREVPFGIITVLTQQGCKELRPILSNLASLGLMETKLNPVFALGRGEAEQAVTAEIFLSTHKDYIQYLIETERPVVDTNFKYMLKNLATRTHPYRCMRSQCGAGREFITLTASGDLYPCSRYRGDRKLCLGHVTTVSTLDNLCAENPTLGRVKMRKVETIPECANCTLQRYCEAGCPLDTLSSLGKTEAPHPWCEYYKRIMFELLAAIAKDPSLVTKIANDVIVYKNHFLRSEAVH